MSSDRKDVHDAKPIAHIKCSEENCTKPASYQVGFECWAVGASKVIEKPQLVVTGIVVCAEHQKSIQIEDFMDASNKGRLNQQLIRSGKRPMDWDGADIRFVPLTGKELPFSPQRGNVQLPPGFKPFPLAKVVN